MTMTSKMEQTLLDCYELDIEKFTRYENIEVYTKYWFFSWLKRYKKTYKRKYFDYHIVARPRRSRMEFGIFSKPMLTVGPEICEPVPCVKRVIELDSYQISIGGYHLLDFKVATRVAWKIGRICKTYETHFFVVDIKNTEEALNEGRRKLEKDLKQHINDKLSK